MSQIGKWIVGVFIGCYLAVLSFGIIGHALKFGVAGNTLSYLVVWDMFCGWQAYDQRTHLIAESESGRYYDLREPWGEFHPYGSLGRFQYDVLGHMVSKHINHLLNHTQHEPIDSVYVVEEAWPKQYNLPERLWKQNFGTERDKISYYHLRATCNGDGRVVNLNPDWLNQQVLNSIGDNPRLRREVSQAHSSFGMWYVPTSGSSRHGLRKSAAALPSTN
ncbi:MAG: hypothetical protein MK110_14590 [Fuerstiella sp.]|nr:hypothetical protein [Fuerstiella sp.]